MLLVRALYAVRVGLVRGGGAVRSRLALQLSTRGLKLGALGAHVVGRRLAKVLKLELHVGVHGDGLLRDDVRARRAEAARRRVLSAQAGELILHDQEGAV